MLSITKLLSGEVTTGKVENLLRGEVQASPLTVRFAHKRPVVVWNLTYRCNLICRHCYAGSMDRRYSGELSTREGLSLISVLGDYGVPVIIFSGGEPILRDDIYEIAVEAVKMGIKPALSTNGTLITDRVAERLKDSGFYYTGISIDGDRATNDYFRGKDGAFDKALSGLRACLKAGLRTGLRFTVTRKTVESLPFIFDLAKKEGVQRLYISHLVYVGRGRMLSKDALSIDETRRVVDYIFDRSEGFIRDGIDLEVVTGNNDADGVYLYYRLLNTEPVHAEDLYRLLKRKGGNSSGVALACIDSFGNVHPDQYWRDYTIGNIRERSFQDIWEDDSDNLLYSLRNREGLLKGRCRRCKHLTVCRGNYRLRALAFTGDLWGEDPACYLTDEEISDRDVA